MTAPSSAVFAFAALATLLQSTTTTSLQPPPPPPPPPPSSSSTAFKVSEIQGTWTKPPANCPTAPSQPVSDGAFTGNGDLGIVVGASPVAPTDLAFYFDLMQFRAPSATGVSKCGYGSGGHVGVGWLGIDVAPNGDVLVSDCDNECLLVI